MKKSNKFYLVLLMWSPLSLFAQQLAFPGALGRGRFASGGREGMVYHVTNLNDEGLGSFRDAVSQPNRTVVFDLGGVIKIKDKVQIASNITIAGQTAPGDGIVIYGNSISASGSQNVIMRYLRFRGSINMPRGACVLVIDHAENMIFDHLSIEWGRWDNLHIKESNNITLQYCIDGESIDPQRFGALIENPTNISIYDCLWIDNQSRNPKAKAKMEFVNNVIYNWGKTGFVGGHSGADHDQDLINNYFIAGPNSNESFAGQFTVTDHVYQKGNKWDQNKNGVLDGEPIPEAAFATMNCTITQHPSTFIKGQNEILTADDAYQMVLKEAGCSLKRDAIDQRLIHYLSSLGKEGEIFKTETTVGGQKALPKGHTLKDKDQDGIPNQWERKHGLSSKDGKDASEIASNGYSHLEEYINSLTHPTKP